MQFGTVALNVAIILAFSIPGFLFIKTKLLKPEAISSFAKLLLYFCQPCLSIYSFQKVTYSGPLFLNMLIFMAISCVMQISVILLLRLIYHRKIAEAKYRIATVAPVLGNVGFIGIPLLEALLPQNPEAVTYAATFIITLNVISWTIGAYIITGDKSYIKPKKILLNPPVLTLFITLPLFFTKTVLPDVLMNFVTIPAKFTTALCMVILGMRFAAADLKKMFSEPTVYIRIYKTCRVSFVGVSGNALATRRQRHEGHHLYPLLLSFRLGHSCSERNKRLGRSNICRQYDSYVDALLHRKYTLAAFVGINYFAKTLSSSANARALCETAFFSSAVASPNVLFKS